MSRVRLSPRLACVARMAEGGVKIADVGTDHGYVAVYLAQGGAVVTAADINAAPLERARLSAEEYGCEDVIRFVLADGLSFPGAEEHDTVIIAGMGGETMAAILEAAPWTVNARLVLQPQSKLDELCLFLHQRGQGIESAELCEDEGRIYAVLRVTNKPGGAMYIEDALLNARDPLLDEWLLKRMGSLRSALSGMERSLKAEGEAAEARAKLDRLKRVREAAALWQR